MTERDRRWGKGPEEHAPAEDRAPGLPAPVQEAFDALDRAGIRWLLLRGDPAHPSGDLDLLVDPVDREGAIGALVSARFVRRRAPEHDPHALLVRRGPVAPGRPPRWWVIDLLSVVEPLGSGSRALPLATALLARSARGADGIPRPHPVDEAWLALLRAGRRPEESPPEVDAELIDEGSVVARGLDVVAGPGAAARLRAAVRRGSAPGVSAELASLRPALLGPGGGGRPSRLAQVVVALLRPAPGQQGVSIAVLGPDGAGKSTLVDALTAGVPLATSVEYLGVFRTSEREAVLRRIPGVALAGKLAKLRGRSLRGALGVRRGRLVVYDRHVVDALLRPGRPTLRSKVSYGLLARACPPPDLFVVLDAPGDVMFARKGEHTPQILEERRQRYLDLQERYEALAVVDATQSPEQVLSQVEDLVWTLYSGAGP